jgi:flavodoxin
MNIGVIVYSQSGHTLIVAKALVEALVGAGHSVALEQVKSAGLANLGQVDVPLQAKPEIDGYDALVFGAGTWGGSIPSPMATYLAQLDSLAGVRVACLVTGFFSAKMGRAQNLAQMKAVCEDKGATVVGGGSVGWLSFRRKRQIVEVVEQLSQLF